MDASSDASNYTTVRPNVTRDHATAGMGTLAQLPSRMICLSLLLVWAPVA